MTIQLAERIKARTKVDTAPLRAAIYARFSSHKQSPLSCQDQIDHITRLVNRGEIKSKKYGGREIIIDSKWIISDEGISGKSTSREGYQLLLDAMSARQRPFDMLLLDDLSRANRDLGNTLDLYQLAKSRGIEIVSASDNLSSEDTNSKIFFTVRGMVADMGNEMHSARTMRGMEMKVIKGLSCGDLAYGYTSRPTRFDSDGGREVAKDFKVEIDPEKAEVVRKIFRMFVAGHGRSSICKQLHEEKIPWPGFHKKRQKGRGWSTSTIHKILKNEKYIGIWVWRKSTYVYDPVTGKKIQQPRPEHEWISHHEGQDHNEDLRIVSQTLWNKTQQMFEKIHDNDKHGHWGRFFPFVQKYMLSQVLKCGGCGASMVLITGRKGGYYGCLDAHRKGTCKNKRLLRRKKLEKAVVDYVLGLLKDESVFESAAKKYNELMNAKLANGEQDLSSYEHELAVIGVELKNLADAVMKGGESKTLFDAIEVKEKRQRWLKYQVKQTKALQKEKIFVTPFAMKEKFKRLVDALRKRPNEASEALKKLFPEGLKMKWCGEVKPGQKHETGLWQIAGLVSLDSKGGTNEIKIQI